MIFDNYNFGVGYPDISSSLTFVIPNFSIGITSIFNSFIGEQSFSNGLTQIPGIAISIYPFIDRLTYFQAIWGINASQNITQLNLKKADLIGLTSKATNIPTALLLGVINRLLVNFPTITSVPVEAYIFSRYVDGDYEYVDIVIKCKAKLSVINGYEIQYFDNSFDPDNY